MFQAWARQSTCRSWVSPCTRTCQSVGYNLQDHYGTGALTFTIPQPLSLVQTRHENIPTVLKYAIFGSGPFTVLGGVEVGSSESK